MWRTSDGLDVLQVSCRVPMCTIHSFAPALIQEPFGQQRGCMPVRKDREQSCAPELLLCCARSASVANLSKRTMRRARQRHRGPGGVSKPAIVNTAALVRNCRLCGQTNRQLFTTHGAAKQVAERESLPLDASSPAPPAS